MKMKELKCKDCFYFQYNCHHDSSCEHPKKPRKGVSELRDGRALACELFKKKKRNKSKFINKGRELSVNDRLRDESRTKSWGGSLESKQIV